MKKIKITGGNLLSGTIKISGAKNSAVALVPASLLSDEITTIDNIPDISDISALTEILEYLGANVKLEDNKMVIDQTNLVNLKIPESKAKKLRASYYFMGALLGKFKYVEIYFPGGCSIGARPIDQHLKGFELLGAKIIEKGNKYIISAEELKGTNIYLDMPSVGATINIMLAAVKATGLTIIENAAKEPEIVNVATFLNNMGAKVTGAGTSEIKIKGVEKLKSGFTEVIPDRIEAGTYLIAGSLIGNNVKIDNIIPEHIEALTSKLKEIGVKIRQGSSHITVSKSDEMKAIKVRTLGYPGFPTDLQQPLTTLLALCEGVSVLEETIYENRFQNIAYLNQMGSNIVVDNRTIYIKGSSSLKGEKVVATDLRAGASLVLAGLVATGETEIKEVEHILRGYEDIIGKLKSLGAQIELVDE